MTNLLLQVKLFAAARQIQAADMVVVELAEPHTVERLRSEIIRQYPKLAQIAQQSRFAVNASYAAADWRISASDELALIPPVSGG